MSKVNLSPTSADYELVERATPTPPSPPLPPPPPPATASRNFTTPIPVPMATQPAQTQRSTTPHDEIPPPPPPPLVMEDDEDTKESKRSNKRKRVPSLKDEKDDEEDKDHKQDNEDDKQQPIDQDEKEEESQPSTIWRVEVACPVYNKPCVNSGVRSHLARHTLVMGVNWDESPNFVELDEGGFVWKQDNATGQTFLQPHTRCKCEETNEAKHDQRWRWRCAMLLGIAFVAAFTVRLNNQVVNLPTQLPKPAACPACPTVTIPKCPDVTCPPVSNCPNFCPVCPVCSTSADKTTTTTTTPKPTCGASSSTPSSSSSATTNSMKLPGRLEKGKILESSNKKYHVIMQADCNLVVYKSSASSQTNPVWSTETWNTWFKPTCAFDVKDDWTAKVVEKDNGGEWTAWKGGCKNKWTSKATRLTITDDGHLELSDEKQTHKLLLDDSKERCDSHYSYYY